MQQFQQKRLEEDEQLKNDIDNILEQLNKYVDKVMLHSIRTEKICIHVDNFVSEQLCKEECKVHCM